MNKNVIKILNDYITICEKIDVIENAMNDVNMKFSIADANLITEQLMHMRGYRDCLMKRIKINGFVENI